MPSHFFSRHSSFNAKLRRSAFGTISGIQAEVCNFRNRAKKEAPRSPRADGVVSHLGFE